MAGNKVPPKQLGYFMTWGFKKNAVLFFILCTTGLSAFADGSDKTCIDEIMKSHSEISRKALEKLFGYNKKFSSQIKNDYAILVDYSKNSKEKRSYLVNMERCEATARAYVIHGGRYEKLKFKDGDPNNDGMLDTCTNKDPKFRHKYMTRPGPYVTAGCHVTGETGWTVLWKEGSKVCQGIGLDGLLKGVNDDALAAGVSLHEHVLIKADEKVKPVGQGCPAYHPGDLKSMLSKRIEHSTLVYIYAPMCGNY
jgi:hypothetical protein